MTVIRPDKFPEWASAGTNNDEPSAGQKSTGWTPGQTGVSDYENWKANVACQWLQFLASAVHWDEKWFRVTADLGAGGNAIGTSGWGYSNASADPAIIVAPSALHPRRFAKIGGNNGIGSSRLHSDWIHWHTGGSKFEMEGRVSISGFGASTGYSIEWGADCASNMFTDRVVIKKKNGSANWWLHVQDASGTSELDLGIAVTVGQSYRLRLTVYNGNVGAYIDDVYAGSINGSINYPFNEKYRFMFQTVETSNSTMGYLSIEGFRAWFD